MLYLLEHLIKRNILIEKHEIKNIYKFMKTINHFYSLILQKIR